MIRLGLIGDFDQEIKAHVAIPKAIGLAASALASQVEVEWLATALLEHTEGKFKTAGKRISFNRCNAGFRKHQPCKT